MMTQPVIIEKIKVLINEWQDSITEESCGHSVEDCIDDLTDLLDEITAR